MLENVDPFKVMDMLGIENKLYCLDLIQGARNEVMRVKNAEGNKNG